MSVQKNRSTEKTKETLTKTLNRDEKLIKLIFKTIKSNRFGSVLVLQGKLVNQTSPTKKNLISIKIKRGIN